MGRIEQFRALLDELKLSDDDKAAALKVAETVPEFADGYLRQADYTRYMNENQGKVKKADEWNGWWERNGKEYDEIRTNYPTVTKELQDLKTKIASGKDIDMTEAQVQELVAKELTTRGIANPTDKQINDAVTKVTTDLITKTAGELETKFVTQTLPSHMGFIADVLDCAADYRGEFGEKMSRDDFIKFCASQPADSKVSDAYGKFVETKRLEKKHVADIETARKEERDKLMNQNLPGSTAAASGPVEAGPALQFIRAAEASKVAAAAAAGQPIAGLGDGSAAAAAAAELRAKGA